MKNQQRTMFIKRIPFRKKNDAKENRYLFLHVGFGKTGSSAIQSWLANNVKGLADKGFSYTVNDEKSVHYRISSGNGKFLGAYLLGKISEKDLIRSYFNHNYPKTIISSEVLELTRPKIAKLKKFCDKHQIRLKAIAYVRDAFDHSCSQYVQLVKGCNYTESFKYFLINDLNELSHILQATLWNRHFDDIKFLHYNTNKTQIFRSLCDVLQINIDHFTDCRRRVNRSLSIEEIAIVQRFVVWRKQYIDDLRPLKLSRIISDWLVDTFHERKSEMIVNQKLVEIYTKKFNGEIDRFNEKIGRPNGFTMRIGDFSSGMVVDKQDTTLNKKILRDVSGFLSGKADILGKQCLIAFARELQKIDIESSQLFLDAYLEGQAYEYTESKEQTLNLPDKYADLLKDAALRIEHKDIKSAFELMHLAHRVRPSGPLIKRKMRIYRNKLGADNTLRL